jgi:hypothetical protein
VIPLNRSDNLVGALNDPGVDCTKLCTEKFCRLVSEAFVERSNQSRALQRGQVTACAYVQHFSLLKVQRFLVNKVRPFHAYGVQTSRRELTSSQRASPSSSAALSPQPSLPSASRTDTFGTSSPRSTPQLRACNRVSSLLFSEASSPQQTPVLKRLFSSEASSP